MPVATEKATTTAGGGGDDNGGGGGGVTHKAAGGDALIGTWAKAEAVDAAAIFFDAGARTWIFLGRIFCVRKQAFYGRTVEQNLILFYPWCYYATQKYPFMRRGICRTYVRNGTKMYGNRNYYRPPLMKLVK